MRNKFISLVTVLALMCVCVIAPCTASAETIALGQCGDNLTWVLNSDGTLTISGTGDMYAYTLGSAPWEEYKDDITVLTVEDGVTSILDYAFCFYGSSQLKTAYIPSSVVSIGDYALGYYYYENDEESVGYTSVSLTIYAEVGSAAFQYAADNSMKFSSTGSLYADDEVLASGTCGDNLVWSVTYGGKLTISGEGKMENSHTYVNANGETVTSDYPEWHKYGFFVTTAEVGEGITNIAKRAFSGFSQLTSVAIPNTVTDIGDRAFYGCAFTEITIPESVTGIGMYAFYNCNKLTSITLPAELEGIEERAFAYCADLADIVIPESVEYIYANAFYGCSNLTSVYYTGASDAWDAIDIDEYGNEYLLKADRYYNYSGSGDNPDYVYKQYTIESLSAAWSDDEGAFIVRVDYDGSEELSEPGLMVVAVYDADGNFIMFDMTEAEYDVDIIEFYLPIDPAGAAASGTVKAAVWQDLNGLIPLSDCVSTDYSIEL